MKKKILLTLSFLITIYSYGQINGINGQYLNRSVFDANVLSVWDGEGLPQGFSGEGVIIGFLDWGFDYSHPVFYDTAMVDYRVIRAWDQFKNEGPAPAGFDYGREYVGREQLLAAQVDTSNVYNYGYHGTHVAGIAGGAGAGTNYIGVAYEAELMFCTFLVNEQAVLDAMDWLQQVAEEEGKRLVINMSWGLFYMNNFDGTGPIGQKIEELTNNGVVIVVSAGNNGDTDFHLSHNFSEHSNDTLKSQITYSYPYDNQYGQSITMTNSPNAPFSFAVQILDEAFQPLATTPFYHTSDNTPFEEHYLVHASDTFYYTTEIEAVDPNNNRPEVRLRVKNLPNTQWNIGLFVTADAGTFHAWNVIELTTDVGNWGGEFTQPDGLSDWKPGDRAYGLGSPSCVESAITVASHNAEVMGIGGNISGFTSQGPTINDVQKPDVSAPGGNVVSAISSFAPFNGQISKTVSFNGKNYIFGKASGTSMSSPFTAGVAALLLQANPYLTQTQIKQILTETARNDAYTEEAGMYSIGHGKVDALAAVQRALGMTGVAEFNTTATTVNLYPNPSNGPLYISLKSTTQNIPLTIYDISGKNIFQTTIQPGVTALSLSHLHQGVYFIQINDSTEPQTYKWIKTH